MGETLFKKVWDAHTVRRLPSGQTQLFVGLHLIHEVTSPQAFDELPGWQGPAYGDGAEPNCWLYTALVDPEKFGMTSRELMAWLGKREIESRPIFAPACENKHLSCPDGRERFPVAYEIWERGIALPSSSGLSDEQIDQVIDAVGSAAGGS